MIRKSALFNVFGRSPIKPMQAHMEIAYKCAALLLPFFKAVIEKKWDIAAALQQELITLKHQADGHKRELRLHLPNNLLLPFARSDLLEMILLQDKIANKAKDIAGLLYGRQMVFPEITHTLFIPFLERCIDTCGQARKAINELDELLETGFSGDEAQIVEKMIDELTYIQEDTDKLQVQLYQALLKIEAVWPPVEVMFLYTSVKLFGELANYANNIGEQLQLLLAK
ncbi:MAG: hypothetical protein LEGION0398_MBIBDBAK_01234 [Legionellaceae bacterium]